MNTIAAETDRQRVIGEILRAISMSRRPGLMFSAHFLSIGIEMLEAGARLTLNQVPYLTDDNGEVDLTCFGIFVDMAIGRGIYAKIGQIGRVATSNLNLSLTGAPRVGSLVATCRFTAFIEGSLGMQALAQVDVTGPSGLVAFASGTFALVNGPSLPPIESSPPPAAPLVRSDLDEQEQWLLAHAEEALEGVESSGGTFISRFWDFTGLSREGGAETEITNRPHLSNRARHFHGGIQIGLALANAQTALGAGWMTTGINTCYLRPGVGEKFRSISDVVHRGKTTAVVTTRILGDQSQAIMQATSTHVARKG